MQAEESVILVDENDRVQGRAGKLAVHREGALHRAHSVLAFNARGELLLQRRAAEKYHSGGLWSNTCCGHPRPGERTEAAARRRLREEMGMRCALRPLFTFCYWVAVGDGLSEHEYLHVFAGRFEGAPSPDPREVEAWRWLPLEAIRREIATAPERYTVWFPLILERLGAPTA